MRFFLLLLLFLSVTSYAQEADVLDLSDMESNKCLYSVLIDSLTKYTHYEDAFVLEITSPVFEVQRIKYSREELVDFKTAEGTFEMPIQESHSFFVLKDKETSYFIKRHLDGYYVCKVEMATRMKEFTLEELEAANYEIEYKALVTKAKAIKKQQNYKEIIRNDSVMSYREGYYTPILTAVGGGHRLQMDFVFKLQKSLQEKGFDVEETGMFDEKTVAAVAQFKRINNLVGEALDRSFFEALGWED